MRHFSLPKLESSRNMTSKVISNPIKARKSKSSEQYGCKRFFCLDGTCNSIVELSNSTGLDFESTIKFNASKGEEYYESDFVCGVWGTEVAFNVKQAKAGWLHSLLSSYRDQQAAAGSLLRMEVILPNDSPLLNTLRQKKNDLMKKDLIDILAPSFANRAKLLT